MNHQFSLVFNFPTADWDIPQPSKLYKLIVTMNWFISLCLSVQLIVFLLKILIINTKYILILYHAYFVFVKFYVKGNTSMYSFPLDTFSQFNNLCFIHVVEYTSNSFYYSWYSIIQINHDIIVCKRYPSSFNLETIINQSTMKVKALG